MSVDTEEEAKRIVDRRLKVAELKKIMKSNSKSSTEQDVGTKIHAVVEGEAKTIVLNAVETVGVKGHLSAAEVCFHFHIILFQEY